MVIWSDGIVGHIHVLCGAHPSPKMSASRLSLVRAERACGFEPAKVIVRGLLVPLPRSPTFRVLLGARFHVEVFRPRARESLVKSAASTFI
jgi:hypothetical protein